MLLSIEKLVYGGDGLARGPEKNVFVPFVLPGEQVEAEIIEQRRGFARAHATRIVVPASNRIEPHCPYFQRCGGCHYQHISYEHQLEIKVSILRETLRRTGKLDWTGEITVDPSQPWNYRNRTRMRVMRKPEFSLAYFRFASHEPLAIAECPISSPLINRAIAAINSLGKADVIPEGIAEIEFFADSADVQLMLGLYYDQALAKADFKRFSAELEAAVPEVDCVAVFFRPDRRDRLPSAQTKPQLIAGSPFLTYQTTNNAYRVSPGAFFQTNRHLTDTLISLVTGNRTGQLALDLYAGVGLFSVPLARSFERVIAVESSPASVTNLRENTPPNVIEYAEPVEGFLGREQSQRLRPDYVVIDPPRAGLGERVAHHLASLAASSITYVSCDPATLARDLRILLTSGYSVEQIHLVDLFPQTFHIETVTHLIRNA